MSWAPTVNPVLDRELRQRLRGRAAWVVLTLYLAVLALILRLVYDVGSRPGDLVDLSLSQAQTASSAGRSIFHWLLFFMLGLICFIVPGLTAAAIAGERERQTLVPLQVTLLSPRAIVFGKLLASLAFVVLLLIAALPLVSVSFLLGGVDAVEVAKGMGMLLVVAVAVASLSLACSSALRRTQTATVTAYGIVAVLVVGTAVIYGAQRALDTRVTGTSAPTVLIVNPFAATAEVIRGRTSTAPDLSSPFTGIQDLLERQVFAQGSMSSAGSDVAVVRPAPAPPPTVVGPRGEVRAVPLGPNGPGPVVVDGPGRGWRGPLAAPFNDPTRRPEVAGMPFWTASLLSFIALAAMGALVAVWRLRLPASGRVE